MRCFCDGGLVLESLRSKGSFQCRDLRELAQGPEPSGTEVSVGLQGRPDEALGLWGQDSFVEDGGSATAAGGLQCSFGNVPRSLGLEKKPLRRAKENLGPSQTNLLVTRVLQRSPPAGGIRPGHRAAWLLGFADSRARFLSRQVETAKNIDKHSE